MRKDDTEERRKKKKKQWGGEMGLRLRERKYFS